MNYRNIMIETRGNVATVTLNRPEVRNALSGEMMDELLDCLIYVEESSEIHVLIIKGAGTSFCSGHDLSELVGRDAASYRATFDKSVKITEAITNLSKPVIAAVHGYASAAGCQLAVACDLMVTSDDAHFETPGVKIGLFCVTPMVALSRSVGRKKSLEMLLTGEPIDAREAERIGLVNRVVPRQRLEEAAMELAEKIASKSAFTVGFGKRTFYAAADMGYETAFRYAEEMMVLNNLAEDAQEGISAFLEHRMPAWKGR